MGATAAVIDQQAAKRFTLIRKHLKLNQTELAEACNISQSAVAKIEGSSLDIPQAVIKVLYIKFNISPVYLVAGEPPMVYKKQNVSSLVKSIPDLQADVEMLKGQVKLLTNFINEIRSSSSKL
jgi:transcriptional regulator with XRE-family HTH domain